MKIKKNILYTFAVVLLCAINQNVFASDSEFCSVEKASEQSEFGLPVNSSLSCLSDKKNKGFVEAYFNAYCSGLAINKKAFPKVNPLLIHLSSINLRIRSDLIDSYLRKNLLPIIREIEKAEGAEKFFNGKDLESWEEWVSSAKTLLTEIEEALDRKEIAGLGEKAQSYLKKFNVSVYSMPELENKRDRFPVVISSKVYSLYHNLPQRRPSASDLEKLRNEIKAFKEILDSEDTKKVYILKMIIIDEMPEEDENYKGLSAVDQAGFILMKRLHAEKLLSTEGIEDFIKMVPGCEKAFLTIEQIREEEAAKADAAKQAQRKPVLRRR